VLPEVGSKKDRPAPDTARATIASPRNGQPQRLIVREAGGYTDGFTASGTCQVPPGYRAVIVSRADTGPGYWLLSDGILNDCMDDSATHQWTAVRVDPSWPGMENEWPVTIGVIIVRKEVAERAQVQKTAGEPINLPQPSATTLTIPRPHSPRFYAAWSAGLLLAALALGVVLANDGREDFILLWAAVPALLLAGCAAALKLLRPGYIRFDRSDR